MESKINYRVFIGGLFHSVTEEDLRERFKGFGGVTDVTVIQKKDSAGIIYKTFGYINLLTDEPTLKKCFAIFGKSKWNGSQLKVQLAKDDFMKRLQKEWENVDPVKKSRKRKNEVSIKSYNEILKSSERMKKSVPGTMVTGETNWVIGKYGRPLPIVSISKTKHGGKNTVKIDPSKYCHCLKKINVDEDTNSVENLTWSFSVTNDDCPKSNKKKMKKKSNINNESYDKDSRMALPKILTSGKNIKRTESEFEKKDKYSKENEIKDKKYNCNQFDLISPQEIQFKSNSTVPISEGQFKENKTNVDAYSQNGNIRKMTNKFHGLSSSIIDQLYKKENTCNGLKQSVDQQHAAELISSSNNHRNIDSEEERIDEIDNDDNITSENPFNFSIDSLRQDQYDDNSNNNFDSNDGKSYMDPEVEFDEDVINPFSFTLDDLKACQKNPISPKFAWDNSEFKITESFIIDNDTDAESEESSITEPDVFVKTCDDIVKIDSIPKNDLCNKQGLKMTKPCIDCTGSIKNNSNLSTVSHSISESNFVDTFDFKIKHQTSPNKVSETEEYILNSNIVTRDKSVRITKNEKNTTSDKVVIDKHSISDETRKKSLEKRNRESKDRNKLIKNALKNIDSCISSKNKIIYSDTESDFQETYTTKLEEKDEYSKDINAPSSNMKSDLNLFEDDSDGAMEDHFEIKKQFQGNEGEKLFKLQQKFGGDERFRMDERFTINDEESDMEKKDAVSHHDVETMLVEGTEKEKERNLSILEDVIGQSIFNEKRCKHKETFDRYDPSKSDHEKYEIIETKIENDDNDENEYKKVSIVQRKEKVELTRETYHEVNPTLKQLFNSHSQSSFSFLGENLSNSKNHQFAYQRSEETEVPSEKKKDEQLILAKKIEGTTNFPEEYTFRNLKSEKGAKKKKMFFTTDNHRFELGKSFKCQEPLELIEEHWKNVRSDLVESYKKKSKDTLRRLRKLKERKYGTL